MKELCQKRAIRIPRVIVFHTGEDTLPEVSEEELKEIQDAVVEELESYEDVEFKGTFAAEDGSGFCDWEAPDAETVEKILEDSGVAEKVPNSGILEVEQVLPVE